MNKSKIRELKWNLKNLGDQFYILPNKLLFENKISLYLT